jgi:hypothetical protein
VATALVSSRTSRLLPTPAGPWTRTQPPRPSRASSHRLASSTTSASRPTSTSGPMGSMPRACVPISNVAHGSAPSRRRSASRLSPLWYRSSGSLAISLPMIAASIGDSSGRIERGSGTGAVACIRISSPASRAWYGVCPVTLSNSTTPRA